MSPTLPPGTFHRTQARRGNAVLVVVLVVLVLAVVVGAVLVFRGSAADPGAGDPDAPPVKESIDVDRFAAYQTGQWYRTVVNANVSGTITSKDFGAALDTGFTYVGEGEIVRHVTANTGEELTIAVELRRARNLNLQTRISGVRIEPPAAAMTIFKQVPFAGEVTKAIELTNTLASNSYALDFVNTLKDQIAEQPFNEFVIAEVSDFAAIEGAAATMHYTRDEGLTRFDSRGDLSADQETILRRVSAVAESYLYPDDEASQWQVDAKDIAILLDPNLKAKVQGSLTIRRGTTDQGIVELTVGDGMIELRSHEAGESLLGRWYPRGELHFDTAQNSIVGGRLMGDVEVKQRSTDHILFEKSWKSQPTYVLTYAGYRTDDPADLDRPLDGAP